MEWLLLLLKLIGDCNYTVSNNKLRKKIILKYPMMKCQLPICIFFQDNRCFWSNNLKINDIFGKCDVKVSSDFLGLKETKLTDQKSGETDISFDAFRKNKRPFPSSKSVALLFFCWKMTSGSHLRFYCHCTFWQKTHTKRPNNQRESFFIALKYTLEKGNWSFLKQYKW